MINILFTFDQLDHILDIFIVQDFYQTFSEFSLFKYSSSICDCVEKDVQSNLVNPEFSFGKKFSNANVHAISIAFSIHVILAVYIVKYSAKFSHNLEIA
ncbi:hypothetical protein BpHYR1_051440 [Brachionus plicatilis]|uniref:Uncharacterized protein n=1 Tax=Brachionus plicatilis TaxID=10195 RepID=A0A3M7SHK3_BRAPC|nr:hypothetical protein BpHYR1_051440 [Brachionus plicatilis]